jgi:uncharacterized protein (TIGR03435 family)
MLQRMLVERFQLAVHHEQRVTTVYVLTLNRSDGRLGPNLAPRTCEAGSRIPFAELTPDAQKRLPASEQARTSVPCGSTTIASGFGLIGFGMKMSALAEAISGYWLGAPVLDRTGLSGGFDITIENIENQWGDRGLRTDSTVSDRPSLPAALQEQLGLKLETRREPFDTLVIDRLERPTED